MVKMADNNYISSEVLAAFLDGNATAEESADIVNALSEDDELIELLHISQAVDAELSVVPHRSRILPMTALAATCDENNYCCLECEKYVLSRLGVEFSDDQLLRNAIDNGWQKRDGTALHRLARHAGKQGRTADRGFYRSAAVSLSRLPLYGMVQAADGR